MTLEKLFADFNNADKYGRVRLNTVGTHQDILTQNIIFEEGKKIWLDDNDGLNTLGILRFSQEEKIWVAEISWENLHNIS